MRSRIYGVAPGEVFRHQPTLIGLQRADKVPHQLAVLRRLGEMPDLVYPFLHVVLAEGALAGGDGFFDRRHRFGFADCKQGNFFWRPRAVLRGGRDAVSDILQVLLDSAHY